MYFCLNVMFAKYLQDCLFYTAGKSCCEFICMDRVVEGKKIIFKMFRAICFIVCNNNTSYNTINVSFSVLCGFCLLSILLIGVFIFYLHKRNRKVATGQYRKDYIIENNYTYFIIGVFVKKLGVSKLNGADLALVEHSSAFEKKIIKI